MSTTREEIKALLAQACPDYTVTYEASQLMAVKVTQKDATEKFIYIEEFKTGKFLLPKGRPASRMTRVQIYFCAFKLFADPNLPSRAGNPNGTAEQRELVREWLTSDAVEPFLTAFSASPNFLDKPAEIPFATPLPRFADGEVSVMIELEVKSQKTC